MEILDTKRRETYGSTLAVSISVGITLVYILGAFLNSWTTVAWVFVGLVVLQFLGLILIPKSPQWLISIGQVDEAEKSLKSFRGSNIDVVPELKFMKSASKNNCDCVMCQEKNEAETSLKNLLKQFFQPESYKPLSLLISLFIFQHLSGSKAVVFYAVDIFDRILKTDGNSTSTSIANIVNGTSITEIEGTYSTSNLAAISVGALKIVGSVLAVLFLKKNLSKRLQVHMYDFYCHD